MGKIDRVMGDAYNWPIPLMKAAYILCLVALVRVIDKVEICDASHERTWNSGQGMQRAQTVYKFREYIEKTGCCEHHYPPLAGKCYYCRQESVHMHVDYVQKSKSKIRLPESQTLNAELTPFNF